MWRETRENFGVARRSTSAFSRTLLLPRVIPVDGSFRDQLTRTLFGLVKLVLRFT